MSRYEGLQVKILTSYNVMLALWCLSALLHLYRGQFWTGVYAIIIGVWIWSSVRNDRDDEEQEIKTLEKRTKSH